MTDAFALVERPRLAELANVSPQTIRAALSRGRLQIGEGLALRTGPDGMLRPGASVVREITLASAAAYFGWSDAMQEAILEAHGIKPAALADGMGALLLARVVSDPETGDRYDHLLLAPVGRN